jgi:hypothetical protein
VRNAVPTHLHTLQTFSHYAPYMCARASLPSSGKRCARSVGVSEVGKGATGRLTLWKSSAASDGAAFIFPPAIRGSLLRCAECRLGKLRRTYHPPAIQQFARRLSGVVRERTLLRTYCMNHPGAFVRYLVAWI